MLRLRGDGHVSADFLKAKVTGWDMSSGGRFVTREQWQRWRAQRKIGIWVQAAGRRSLPSPRISPRKNLEIVYAKSCNLVHLWLKNGSQCVDNAFLNILTMGMAFPGFPHEDP